MTSSASNRRRRPFERARRLLRDHGISADIIATRFDQAELPGKFDAIVFSWFCYCYILGTAERTAALAKARAHLNAVRPRDHFIYRRGDPAADPCDDHRAGGRTTHRRRLAGGAQRSFLSSGGSYAFVCCPAFVRS